MSNIFDSYQSVPKYKRNLFNLSRENLFSCNFGEIVPIMCEPLCPGDSFKLSPSAIVKTAPMLAPIYGQINIDIHCFVVPLRILWDRFDDWIYDPTKTASSGLSVPSASKKHLLNRSNSHNLLNYLKLPHSTLGSATDDRRLNVFKLLGYLQIWKEYFRDEDLQSYPDFLDEPQTMDYDFVLADQNLRSYFTDFRRRCWRKDYFTSARPWPQKGTPPVLSLFQQTQMPVFLNVTGAVPANGIVEWPAVINRTQLTETFDNGIMVSGEEAQDASISNIKSEAANWKLFWDTSMASGVSIAQLRSLFAVQKYLEMSAVVGSRYIEGNLAFWGVKVKDYRAQIPEFLGMTTQILHIDEVVQNSESDITVQGHRTGQGSTAFVGKTFKYYASEYSLVYVLFSVRPRAVYPLGLDRFWNQLDQFDFPAPIFQSIGEQEIHQEELGVPALTNDWDDFDKTFGYQSRYAHIRSSFDELHGDFLESLRYWNIARFFDNPDNVLLDENFITIRGDSSQESNSPLNRIFAVTEEKNNHHFWCDAWISWLVKRELHYHTTPALIG